jgi:large subunit ribosomal protein L1
MAKSGKKYNKVKSLVDSRKLYSLSEACELLVKTTSAKFDESVELAVRLGVDPRKADQNVRGSAPLPHGLGKIVRVAVFAKGAKAEEAVAAGADVVGAEDLADRIKEGFQEFDSVVATPDMMITVGKIGKILGPRNLMPSPKVGTVTFDVGDVIRSIKAGRAEFKVEKAGIIHVAVGKASFGPEKIAENIGALVQVLNRVKPSTSRGVYLRGASIALTMGPGIALDPYPLTSM